MDVTSLLVFSGVYFLAVASPGPSIAALTARALATGFAVRCLSPPASSRAT